MNEYEISVVVPIRVVENGVDGLIAEEIRLAGKRRTN